MIPHPVTMRYLWDEEIQSPARTMLAVLLLTIGLLVGSHFLVEHTAAPPQEVVAETTGDR